MEKKVVLVEITSKFKQNSNRPRPKWWDNFIGEKFMCYDECEAWWKLTAEGLEKLSKLKTGKIYGAIIHKECGNEVKESVL